MKAIIPAAGLGTRLLPATKEQPKEMLPLFVQTYDGEICLKPLLQIIFEQLYQVNIREFCFISGRTKRTIEDHFTPDPNYLSYLYKRNKNTLAKEMERFYHILHGSSIFWVNQPEPRGFGDAVLHASSFILDDECFLVYAGDNYVISPKNAYIRKLTKVHNEFNSDVTFIVDEVKNPSQYGVIVGKELGNGIFNINKVIEKPQKPPSKIAIHAIYIFNSKIFKAIKQIQSDSTGEIQLTSAIQYLLDNGSRVYGVKLASEETRIDVGDPYTYWQALQRSYNNSQIKKK